MRVEGSSTRRLTSKSLTSRVSVVSAALAVLGTRLRWRGVIEERRIARQVADLNSLLGYRTTSFASTSAAMTVL